MSPPPTRIFLSAGEPSGDLHGGFLIAALKRWGEVELSGVGGLRMAQEGMPSGIDLAELSVMGLSDVVRSYGRLKKVFERVVGAMLAFRPDRLVLIDFAGFNLRLGRVAKAHGIEVHYYIPPKVWAWGTWRAAKVLRSCDRIHAIFPFEEPFWRARGMAVDYVGHPCVDQTTPEEPPGEWRARHGLGDAPVALLLPGSRGGELKFMMPLMAQVQARLQATRPEVRTVIQVAPGHTVTDWQTRFRHAGGDSETVVWSSDAPHAAMQGATAAVATSGTVNLELALAGTPMVVVYKADPVTWAIGRRLVKLPQVAPSNIIAGCEVAPELLQERAEPEGVFAALLPLLDPQSPERLKQLSGIAAIRRLAGPSGVADRAARLILAGNRSR